MPPPGCHWPAGPGPSGFVLCTPAFFGRPAAPPILPMSCWLFLWFITGITPPPRLRWQGRLSSKPASTRALAFTSIMASPRFGWSMPDLGGSRRTAVRVGPCAGRGTPVPLSIHVFQCDRRFWEKPVAAGGVDSLFFGHSGLARPRRQRAAQVGSGQAVASAQITGGAITGRLKQSPDYRNITILEAVDRCRLRKSIFTRMMTKTFLFWTGYSNFSTKISGQRRMLQPHQAAPATWQ